MVSTTNTTSLSTSSTLTPLIAQANVIATQARSRQDYWTNFNPRSETNLDRFDIAKRLLVSDSEFALKLLELAVQVYEKVEVDREDLVKEKEEQMDELKTVKEDVQVFKSHLELKKSFHKAVTALDFHATALADKTTRIVEPQDDRFDALVARNRELEQKLKSLQLATQKMKEDMEIELEG